MASIFKRLGVLSFVAALAAFLPNLSGAAVSKAISGYDGLTDSLLPQKLSETGLYVNMAAQVKTLTPGIVAFTVNSPLWSDDAHKNRWINVPAGKQVTPSDSDHYQFPDSTVFIKNFALDTVYGDTNTRIVFETRFLVVSRVKLDGVPVVPAETTYYGITYKWNREQTEGWLVTPNMGLDTGIMLKWGGREVAKRWHYPSNNDCAQCHTGRGVLGFLTPQLNTGENGADNQLAKLTAAGVLTSNPVQTKPSLLGFRWRAANDPGASDSVKARSYFAANCAQCHGNGHIDMQGADHDFDWFTPNKQIRWDSLGDQLHAYVGKPSAEQNYPKLIYPGWPESSYVMRRLTARGDLNGTSLYQMPPLATYQIDSAAVLMMKNYICGLGNRGAACQLPAEQQVDSSFWMFPNSPDSMYGPWYKPPVGIFPHKFTRKMAGFRVIANGRTLILEGRSRFAPATLHDFRGREVPLTRVKSNLYYIAGAVRPGVYIVKSGRDVARINLMP